jgi:hypothetical protein
MCKDKEELNGEKGVGLEVERVKDLRHPEAQG